MRYKKKYALYLFGAGWCVWYIGLFHTDPNADGVITFENDGSPDILRYKLLQVAEEDKEQSLFSPFANNASDSSPDTVNNSLTTHVWLEEFLPHVKDPVYIQPRVKWSQGRKNVSIVIGIPTIQRPTNDSYILDTLQSFFDAMTDQERSDVIIVVSITEPWNLEYESKLLKSIKERFPAQLEEGALEVIAPHPYFYPDLNQVKLSLGDSKSRVKWRSKQNLDYGFLMMHCMGKAKYYLQMEDDISTVQGFVSSIKASVDKQYNKQWMSLCFSQLGYIGRLYKIWSVRGIMEYLIKNFDKKPCDWLQYDYLRQVFCPTKLGRKECDLVIKKYTWLIKPTLFQHKGFRSSFQGNINKLQDKYFAQGKHIGMYSNPKTKAVLTSLQTHNGHKVHSAYYTKGFFWGKHPRKGDTIEFIYDPPITVSRIAMMSGQPKHPNDVIANASVEILPAIAPASNSSLLTLEAVPLYPAGQEPISIDTERARNQALPILIDTKKNFTFYVVGHFKGGQVSSDVSSDAGKIRIIRVRFGAKLDHWVILDQILVV